MKSRFSTIDIKATLAEIRQRYGCSISFIQELVMLFPSCFHHLFTLLAGGGGGSRGLGMSGAWGRYVQGGWVGKSRGCLPKWTVRILLECILVQNKFW